jgi:hypothetical protein
MNKTYLLYWERGWKAVMGGSATILLCSKRVGWFSRMYLQTNIRYVFTRDQRPHLIGFGTEMGRKKVESITKFDHHFFSHLRKEIR